MVTPGVGFNLTVPHQFGVIPRYVQIYACAGDDDLTSNNPPSAILLPNWYYIPDGSQEGDAGCVGVQITSLTTEHVIITVCPRFGYCSAAPGGQGRFLGTATGDALRVIMEP